MKIKIIVVKKKCKAGKKICWSMKHSKMIKMAATGTGAKEVVIGWLLCRGAQVCLVQNLL